MVCIMIEFLVVFTIPSARVELARVSPKTFKIFVFAVSPRRHIASDQISKSFGQIKQVFLIVPILKQSFAQVVGCKSTEVSHIKGKISISLLDYIRYFQFFLGGDPINNLLTMIPDAT